MKELDNSIHLVLKEPNLKKRLAKVKQLIKKGTDLTKRNENLETPLHVAISQGFEGVAEVLIKKLPVEMLNTICRSGLTPLYLAVQNNNFKIAQFLLKHGASASRDSFVKDWNMRTPLQVAFHFKNYKMINLLLEEKADNFDSITSELGRLSLKYAIEHEYMNIVQLMLENGKYDTKEVLRWAKSIKMTRVLLKHFLPHLYLNNKKIDFKMALLYELSGLVEHFVKNEPEVVNYVDKWGRTYLDLACIQQKPKMIETMIKHGFNVNAKNNNGYTSLHVAVFRFCNPNIVKVLIENGADINTKSYEGDTPLMMAISHGHFEVVNNLYKSGASMTERNFDGLDPLEVALKQRDKGLSFRVVVMTMSSLF